MAFALANTSEKEEMVEILLECECVEAMQDPLLMFLRCPTSFVFRTGDLWVKILLVKVYKRGCLGSIFQTCGEKHDVFQFPSVRQTLVSPQNLRS